MLEKQLTGLSQPRRVERRNCVVQFNKKKKTLVKEIGSKCKVLSELGFWNNNNSDDSGKT